jgi:hypothetical protein
MISTTIHTIKVHFHIYRNNEFYSNSFVRFYVSQDNVQNELNSQALGYFDWYERENSCIIQVVHVELIKNDLEQRIIKDLNISQNNE